ncbi:MAG: hypothetical protein HRT61_05780 [Ekhidna sp.]|nr:hypothetical protein [Ekhidna sp.]
MKFLKFILLYGVTMMSLSAQSATELSQKEMLADYDELIHFLNDFAVHKDLNAIRLGIDYERQFSSLRSEISSSTTPCEFRSILERATNLVQDLHCSSMGYDYLSRYGQYQNKLNFKGKEKAYAKVKSFEQLCNKPSSSLVLPLIYSNDGYQCFADFIIGQDTVRKGSSITAYNGQSIQGFVQANPDKVWPIKVDAEGNSYNEYFYRYGEESFQLTVETEGVRRTMDLTLTDSISFLTKPQREISYYSQYKGQVIASRKNRVLYVGLPFMDQSISKALLQKIDSTTAIWQDFEKVIIDIRGNPGGNDMAWREVVQHFISEPIKLEVDLKYRYNERTIDHYGSKKTSQKELVNLLLDAPYWSEKRSTISLKPDTNSLNFKGKIYVLQDQYIYSSAVNFSNVCLSNDQMISIGSRTDLVGGLQKEPLFYQLNHSGLIYRVEPVLDFSNVNHISDFAHNEVEINVSETVEDRFKKVMYEGGIYAEEFLFNQDRLVQLILND